MLAGGTDLLVQLRAGMVAPDLIVDIKRLDETRTITESDGGYRIGAAVAGAELGENAAVCSDWPGVTEGAELIGSTQVQGRASMGGNLCNASPAADAVPALIAGEAVDQRFVQRLGETHVVVSGTDAFCFQRFNSFGGVVANVANRENVDQKSKHLF